MSPEPDVITVALQRFGLERDRMRAALVSQAGISGTDLDALEHLEADGPLTQRQLGERLAFTSGAITMLVDRLEKAGWVRRVPHPRDRRSVLVELTPEAIARSPAALADFHARIRMIASEIPAEHREAVRGFLAAAADAASAAAGGLRSRAR